MPIATVLDEEPTQEFKPVIESSTYRSYTSYVNGKFEEECPRKIKAQYDREMDFLSKVDLSKGPINRQVTRIFRIKQGNQEYLIYQENWFAKDWKGAEIMPISERIEGVHVEIKTVPSIDEKGLKIGTDLVGNKDVYEILFNKAAVDRIIESSFGTDKETITFTVSTKTRRDNCNYDQFVGTNWNEANDIMMQDGGFEKHYINSLRNKANVVKTPNK